MRAVKLNPLKVLSAQALFLDSGFLPNVDFFEGDEDAGLVSNNKDICIIGDAADKGIANDSFFAHQSENAVNYGYALAETMVNNVPFNFTPSVVSDHAEIVCDLFQRANLLPIDQPAA